MACSSGCSGGPHGTYGECLRSKALQIDRHGLAGHRAAERDKDQRLTRYEDARRQGLQPKNTSWPAVRAAFETGGVPKSVITQNG